MPGTSVYAVTVVSNSNKLDLDYIIKYMSNILYRWGINFEYERY